MQAYHTTTVHGPVKIIPNNIIGKFKIPTMKCGFYVKVKAVFPCNPCSYLYQIKLNTKLENQFQTIFYKITEINGTSSVKIIPNNIIGKFKIPTMKSGFYGFSNNRKVESRHLCIL